jgi:hypothetical protein
MKSNKFAAIVFVIVIVAVSCVSAFGQTPGSTSLNNTIDLPGFHFGYDTTSAGGKINFNANMSNMDRLSGVSIGLSRDQSDPTGGWVYANFWGTVGDVPVAMDWQSQSTYVSRHGFEYSAGVSLGSYQEILDWPKDGDPVYGNWMSSGSAYATLFNVTPTSANMNYTEYVCDSDGVLYTCYNGSVEWRVEFGSSESAAMYGAVGQTSVPEPATLSLLVLGGFSLLARRRQRQ